MYDFRHSFIQEATGTLSQDHTVVERGFERGSVAPESSLLIPIHSFSHLAFPAILRVEYYNTHFPDKKTESQRSNLSKGPTHDPKPIPFNMPSTYFVPGSVLDTKSIV